MSATGPVVHSFTAHFIQRWNFVKRTKYEHIARYAPLPPAFGVPVPLTDSVGALGSHFADKLHLRPSGADANTGTYAQLCRSATKWSQGIELERSIQNAYIDLITHSNCTFL